MTDSCSVDASRRFGGIDRLYGPGALERLSQAHVVVAGIGGVGSWCAEALARSGVGALTLIDLDHVAESNVNRQLHALDSTLGQAKVQAMGDRIRQINPSCQLELLDAFVEPESANTQINAQAQVVIDCTDQASAKIALILQARARKQPLVVCGGAGGKTNPLALRSGDISQATHDALLSRLRQILRRDHGFPRAAQAAGKVRGRVPRMGVRVLWFDQPVILPQAWQSGAQAAEGESLQGLSCAGYGSAVTVTASMGMAAASEAITRTLKGNWA